MRPLRVMLSLVFAVLLLSSAAVVWGAPRLQDGGAAPQVVQTDPALNGKFYIHDDISFYFDQIMDHDSVEAAFSVEPSVKGRFSWRNANTEQEEQASAVVFIPDEYLDRSTTYTFTIGPGAQSVEGVPLAQPFTLELKTGMFGKHLDYMAIGYAVIALILGGLVVWLALRFQALRREEQLMDQMEAEDRAAGGDRVAAAVGAVEAQARPAAAAPGVTDMVAPSERGRNTPDGM
ncbi:MAG TPA: Ig-like domain-containing protein [Aggregatilineaceae bacterium]|nr:Ig-like domain-containing protein [Aggregatilineaceae bacterium]